MLILAGLKRLSLGIALSMLGAAAAVAATVPAPTCSITSVTTSTECMKVLGNNDSLADMNALSVLGQNTWTYGGKALDSGADDNVSPFNLSGTGKGTKSGTWAVDSFTGVAYAALVIKGGAEAWVAYLLDLTKTDGRWTTNDILNKAGKQPDLSHMTLYVVKATTPPPPAIPLPAPAFLLVAGLGALVAMRRRA